MNETIAMDAEYESIRTVMMSRGSCGNQLPGRTVAYIPADRADTVLELDKRLQQLKRIAPPILAALLTLFGFALGRMC